LSDFAALLAAQRRDLVNRLASARRDLDDIRTARTDATADDEHDPEGSTLTADWSLVSGSRDDALAQLAATDRAIERMKAGTFGTCLRCGKPIAPARLEARPAAELCIECARATGS
jgi:RNA polymerase-binding protein DksA